uniref:Uncharacterized protein n=1 Tax=Setaria italica TaxID=4555 RepID=K4AJ92_SETIT
MVQQSEWPLSPCVLRVFSLKIGQWEERSFIREGEATGTIANMRSGGPQDRNALQVIKPPIQEDGRLGLHLGKLERGVYFALVHERCKLKWVLMHEADLTGWVLKHGIEQQVHGPWTLHDINYDSNGALRQNYKKDDAIEALMQSRGITMDNILGFHPYKEIIFLCEKTRRGLACHLNGTKVQDLGNLYPTRYDGELLNEEFIEQCIPYAPSWIMGPSREK